jgi:hypothetical protein
MSAAASIIRREETRQSGWLFTVFHASITCDVSSAAPWGDGRTASIDAANITARSGMTV